MKEIRDYELYKEDGFQTWKQYCRERWELGDSLVRQLIAASELRQQLPTVTRGNASWSERSVRELTRIPSKK